jgi:cysteine desulfurase
MEVYLDNSATTRPYKEVVETVTDILNNNYANPSSLHSLGKKAEDSLKNARQTIARTLNCNESEIIFTSGGTESDNLAILGYAMANRKRGNKLITQKTEHMAVLQGFKFLESQGFSVYYADVDENGFVDIDDIIANVDDNTILVSIMHVNNETGAIMDIEALSKRLDHSKCVLHVDAVQSYGKININTRTFGADMISISSHKIHGPNGVGALYVKDKIRISPVMHGGNQEAGLRSGTENLAGICGFAKAAEIKFSDMQKTKEHISNLKRTLLKLMSENIDNVIVNSPENSIYSILNVAFPGLKSEVLLHILESKGIYISTGSACNSKKKLNYVLKSMGIKDNVVDSSIRFSFSEFNTMEDITYVVEVLKKEVPLLRKIMR